MDLIEKFIAQYHREFDFFDAAARLVSLQLESALTSSGIRAMVTYRAKRPERLDQKLRQRNVKRRYKDHQEIYDDIADFAGVRVALYFPGARDEVDKVIGARFDLIDRPKSFPTGATPSYNKRFSGYWATHYRLKLRESSLQEGQKRYAAAQVEVQVASVLMHAWSEVEHDLVYKPLQGTLSDEEYAILDELNGLVLAGEIALERLQKAGEARVTREGTPFASHFELAAYLVKAALPLLKHGVHDSALGRVDALYELLKRLGLNTAEKIKPYIEALHADTERRSIADQVVDQIVASDPGRYKLYSDIRHRFESSSMEKKIRRRSTTSDDELGTFMRMWVELERRMAIASKAQGLEGGDALVSRRWIEKLSKLDLDSRRELDRIRMIRNLVVHGGREVERSELAAATMSLRRFLKQLDGELPANAVTK
ncbi:RelA/SpoT domain-containing protein [Burkholderia gladioli]|uniref:RelA/SpoT domain-containing protein n=1 Tax=Burkholderia gladioli TaxID=28095 RepID=UPI0016407084|nr:RelA/SpoT domain-containing protein [Burkholderia gladioli]